MKIKTEKEFRAYQADMESIIAKVHLWVIWNC